MRYGFVIDQNRCIGCHACTVACKEEHGTPLGVFRTWVKYIEKGTFPNASRHFAVMRCNHCDAAPCVEICPTSALFYREDRIVDFDNRRCIGCQSCMQACPYDALYIDPASHTAAKCNFCAHRVELNLEPACVVVCPTRAISAGDLDNAASNVGTIVATQKTAVRKPYKGTRPKLFYLGIDGAFLQPASIQPQSSHLFAGHNPANNDYSLIESASSPGADTRAAYDVAHRQAWDWMSAAYLWTKSIAAGVVIVAVLAMWLPSLRPLSRVTRYPVAAPLAAILFTGITALFLIGHLKRPDRFYYILIKPNPRSWLVRGTWILMAYSMLTVIWVGLFILGKSIPALVYLLSLLLALATAGYSAFLFAQAKGRDLWQSPLFLWLLIAQAAAAGSAILLLLECWSGADAIAASTLPQWLGGALAAHALIILTLIATPTETEDATRAIRVFVSGALRYRFWALAILGGTVLPLALIAGAGPAGRPLVAINFIAALSALVGLFVFDDIWITAGQAPPLS